MLSSDDSLTTAARKESSFVLKSYISIEPLTHQKQHFGEKVISVNANAHIYSICTPTPTGFSDENEYYKPMQNKNVSQVITITVICLIEVSK